MDKLTKYKNALSVLSVSVMAVLTILTATGIYLSRNVSISPVSPESQPLAWDCTTYTFNVSQTGVVTVTNNSARDESAQSANVYINGALVRTFSVPAVGRGRTVTLGTVTVPQGGFSWSVVGSRDCRGEGTYGNCFVSLPIRISVTPTPTRAVTPTRAATPTTRIVTPTIRRPR